MHSGKAYLQDRHGKGNMEPAVDRYQDWTIVSGYENDTHTVLHVARPLDTCDEGYEGNPDIACVKIECRVDDDCLDTHACRNEKCRPVCGPGNAPCGGEAICTAENHEAVCSCPPGLEGNPLVLCGYFSHRVHSPPRPSGSA